MRGSVCGSLRSLRRDKRGDGERGDRFDLAVVI